MNAERKEHILTKSKYMIGYEVKEEIKSYANQGIVNGLLFRSMRAEDTKIVFGVFIEMWYSEIRTYIRRKEMVYMLFVSGIHGVGKTCFCNMIKEKLGIKN